MISEFRDFILRGNLVDLAVAFVVGAAFAALVSALTTDLITPLIAALGGEPDFSALSFTVNGSEFTYGHFLNALISFLIAASVLFFLIVKPMNHLLERVQGPTAADLRDCPECLSKIPLAARRCAHCTAEVPVSV